MVLRGNGGVGGKGRKQRGEWLVESLQWSVNALVGKGWKVSRGGGGGGDGDRARGARQAGEVT